MNWLRECLCQRQIISRRLSGFDWLSRLVLIETSSFLERIAPASPINVTFLLKEVIATIHWFVLVIPPQVVLQFLHQTH